MTIPENLTITRELREEVRSIHNHVGDRERLDLTVAALARAIANLENLIRNG